LAAIANSLKQYMDQRGLKRQAEMTALLSAMMTERDRHENKAMKIDLL